MGSNASCWRWIVCLAMIGGMQSVSTPAVAASPQEAPRPEAQPRDRSAIAAATARIRGHVTDDLGNPVARVWVAAWSGALPQPVSTLTDADGRFELTRLAAGRYLLRAAKPGHASREWTEGTPGEGRQVDIAAGQTIERVAIVLRRGAVLVGRIVDDSGAPVPDVAVRALQRVTRRGRPRLVAAERTATTDDRGEYRLWGIPEGTYVVSAESKPPVGPFSATSGTGYAPTFAPGTSAFAEAARFPVVAGQEVTADIRLVLDKLVRVTGTVVSSNGEPVAGGLVQLVPAGEIRREGPSGMIMEGGRFSLPAVPPGAYLLVVRNGVPRAAGVSASSSRGPESAVLPIDVGREDLAGLRVVTSRGAAATGIVAAESGSLPTHAPVRVQLVPADPDLAPLGAALVPMDAAGRFTVSDIFGPVLVQPLLPRGWITSSIIYDGVNVTERPFELRSDGGPIRVVISDRQTSVGGTITDERGRPVVDCEVLIFADDQTRWQSGSRSVRKTRPDQNGVYRAEGLAPGRYHVVALPHVDEDSMTDATVLSSLRAVSESVALTIGSPQRLDLRATEGR